MAATWFGFRHLQSGARWIHGIPHDMGFFMSMNANKALVVSFHAKQLDKARQISTEATITKVPVPWLACGISATNPLAEWCDLQIYQYSIRS
jgi:hypothetical protein